jgi:proteasome beta subunit
MNGDFLSLLPKSPFAAGLGPVAAGAGPAALEATTVFAFHCAAGVLVAGDHRATAGNVVFSDRTEKIIELDRHSLLAIAGSPAVAIEMARTLQTTFEFYRRSQFQPMSLPAKMRALSRLLHENAPAALQGFGLVSPIFAATMLAPDGPRSTFTIRSGPNSRRRPMPARARAPAASRASCITWSNGAGQSRRRCRWSQAVCLANRLLLTAAEFDTATGGVDPAAGEFATVKLLDPDGVRPIGPSEQAQFWREAAP